MKLVFMEFENTAIKSVLTTASSTLRFACTNSFTTLPNVLNYLIRDNHKHMQKVEDWYYNPYILLSSFNNNQLFAHFVYSLTNMALPYYFEANTRHHVISFINISV